MASLQQALDGVPNSLHCHKVIELLLSPSIKQNPALFNHAIQYLRIKAIKGDVEAKVKLVTILDGQLLAAVAASQKDQVQLWQGILDRCEAELWGKSLYDRGLALAMTPCLGLVESDLLLRQKVNSKDSTNENNKDNTNEDNKNNTNEDNKDNTNEDNKNSTNEDNKNSTNEDSKRGTNGNNKGSTNGNSNGTSINEISKGNSTAGNSNGTSIKNKDTNNDTKCFRLMDAMLDRADSKDSDDGATQLTKQQKDANKLKGGMCYLVGLLRLKGIGLEKDLEQAIVYFKRASELDHDGANYQLAMLMEDHYNYPELYDLEKSVTLYEKVATRKKKKNNNHNGSTTMNQSMVALSASDAKALMKLARVYYEGDHQGESKNMDKAYLYARKVAEMEGEKYCQFMVGDILLQQNNTRESLFWLTQSGQQGFPLAIEALARVYFEGVPPHVKQDYELAHEWCLKGDDIWPSGLGYCQSRLGDMYRQGLGVPKDQMKSFEYYQKAASQQDSPQNYARYMLGEMFYHGDGWIQNLPVAKDYYQIAANEQYIPAQQRLVEIEAHERQKHEQELASQKSNKPWRILSLFGGRRKVSA